MSLPARLALFLFALALLPGAPVHAHGMAGAATAGRAAPPADMAAPVTCHEAPGSVAPRHDAHPGRELHPAAPASAADCCPGTAAHGGCGSACACPAAAPALSMPLPPATATVPATHAAAPGCAARSGRTHAPADRPPIG